MEIRNSRSLLFHIAEMRLGHISSMGTFGLYGFFGCAQHIHDKNVHLLGLNSNKLALHFAIDAMPFNQTKSSNKQTNKTHTERDWTRKKDRARFRIVDWKKKKQIYNAYKCKRIVCLAQTGIWNKMPTLRSRLNEIVIGFIKYSIHNISGKKWENNDKTHKTEAHANPVLIGWMSVLYSFFFFMLFLRVYITLPFCPMHSDFVFELHSIRFGFFRSLFQFHCIRSMPIQNHMDFWFCFHAIQRFYLWWVISLHSGTTWGNFQCTCVGIMLMQSNNNSHSIIRSSIIVSLLFSQCIRGK